MDNIILIDHTKIQDKNHSWNEWCKSCKRYHRVSLQPCPDCGHHYTPQPKSDRVYDSCLANYSCDGCQAYRDHYT